jgi:putative IMPACT (imprinted ancient) family translation regulator
MNYTLKDNGRGPKKREKKSIFICSAFTVKSKDEAKERIQQIRDEMPKASHHAYAYRLGAPLSWEDSSDDGEVKGCAGVPIMNILRNKELVNTLVIVTRFYGGINLGPSGLIKNYSKCALDLIEKIGLKPLKA